MTRGMGIQILLMGFFAFWAFVAIYAVFDFFKRLSNKKGRAEIAQEVSQNVKFIATDKEFHKSLAEEFRPQIILFSILGIVLLLSALGIN